MASFVAVHRFALTRAFQYNARFYAPAAAVRLLEEIAQAPALVVLLDVDTLERSVRARIERVLLLALDALSRGGVHIALAARDFDDRATQVVTLVPRAWIVERSSCADEIRQHVPDARIIAISDDPSLLASLGDSDRGIALCDDSQPDATLLDNVVLLADVSIRAAL